MDRPDSVFCFFCKADIGYFAWNEFLWDCEKCGRHTTLDKRGRSIEASPAHVALRRRMEETDRDFKNRQKPFLIHFSLGRASTGRYFVPTQELVGSNAAGPTGILAILGCILLFTPLLWLGVFSLGSCFFLFSFLYKKGNERLQNYMALEKERLSIQNSLRKEAETLIPKKRE